MLEEKLINDYKEALKAKDQVRTSTLSFLRAALSNMRIEKKVKVLEDADVLSVIKKQVKNRQDSIEQFEKGGRKELAEKETKELEILKDYLPAQLSEAEVKKTVEGIIKEVGAQSMKDMGKVMKEVITRIGAQADGKLISSLVKASLSGAGK